MQSVTLKPIESFTRPLGGLIWEYCHPGRI